MAQQILIREDQDAARILFDSMTRDGVDIRLNTAVQRVAVENGTKFVHLRNRETDEAIAADQILIGVGRAPNVEGLDLEAVGVKYDLKKGIHVNDRLQTTNPQIYACGDVCLPYKFTHTADATARIVIQNALFFGRKKASALVVPWCTYTSPEVAHVGMYERDANSKGIATDTHLIPFSSVDRAVADGEEEGFVKVLTKTGTDKILGATIVARHAGEMISEITLAITNHIGLAGIAATIHPYPTQAEAIKKAADAYSRTRLTPFVKRIFEGFLAWRR